MEWAYLYLWYVMGAYGMYINGLCVGYGMQSIEPIKLTEAEQRRVVLAFLEGKLVTYGSTQGQRPYDTCEAHASIYLSDPTYPNEQVKHRGKLITFQILKGMDFDHESHATQVNVESITEQV